jgi:hypothetical protein
MRDPNRTKFTPEEERATAETLADLARHPTVQHRAERDTEIADAELVHRMADAGLLPPEED